MRLTQPYKKFYSIIFVMIICNIAYSQYNFPPNPCPTYFSYKQDRSSIIGSIRLDPPQLNEEFVVNITLSVADLLPSEYSGTFLLPGSQNELYKQVLNRLPLMYKVLFPPGVSLPRITSINVNGYQICYGPPDIGSQITTIYHSHNFRAFMNIINSNTLNDVSYNHQSSPTMSSNFVPYTAVKQQQFSQPNIQTIPYQSATQTSVSRIRNRQPFLQPVRQPILQPSVSNSQNIQQPPQSTNVYPQPVQETISCGIPAVQGPGSTPLIVGGVDVERGSWPWLVAIHRHTIEKQVFICGGSLVSRKAVITAGHCAIHNNEWIPPAQLLVILGRHNRQTALESGIEPVGVNQIIPHPDYRPFMGYDADIAVIVLQRNVEYTYYIRPICLPSMPRNLAGLRGTVAGWGKTEDGLISPVPLKVQEPIVSESECDRSNTHFRVLISRRTFCAGDRSGSGPCLGDSGGGFGIYTEGRWTLYGTVAASLKTANTDCDLFNYVIYCNVSEFLIWLRQYI